MYQIFFFLRIRWAFLISPIDAGSCIFFVSSFPLWVILRGPSVLYRSVTAIVRREGEGKQRVLLADRRNATSQKNKVQKKTDGGVES